MEKIKNVGIKKYLFLLVLLLLACSFAFSEKVYTVTESQMNELEEIQKTYEILQTDYEQQLKTLNKQIKDMEKSYKKLKRRDTILTISVGVASLGVGTAAGLIIYSIYGSK